MPKKPSFRKATIYDIAAKAKTSASTVSLVLNGSWERYRINSDTAKRVLTTAEAVGYNANLQARGLRLSRSNLAGMIIPHYRNRFFAGLAETFEVSARERGLCPVVVSTQRDPAIERHVVETLIAQRVECLIVTGVDRPDYLNGLCRSAGIACVNLDLPGTGAPSVVSDNRAGSLDLTKRLIDLVLQNRGDPREILFVGGRENEFATDERIAGFEAAFLEAGLVANPGSIIRCGYTPLAAHDVFVAQAEAGRLSSGTFVNSITALEGFARFLRGRSIDCMPVACFDWDPFAASMPVPVLMMRQDVEEMMRVCFEIIDGGDVASRAGEITFVSPSLPSTKRPPVRTGHPFAKDVS